MGRFTYPLLLVVFPWGPNRYLRDAMVRGY